MSDNGLFSIAGLLLLVGCIIGGLILASGVLASAPGANMLMAIAVLLLVPATVGLLVLLWAWGKDGA